MQTWCLENCVFCMKFLYMIDRCGLLHNYLWWLLNSVMYVLLDCQQVYQEVDNRAIGFGIYVLQALSNALSFSFTTISIESTAACTIDYNIKIIFFYYLVKYICGMVNKSYKKGHCQAK